MKTTPLEIELSQMRYDITMPLFEGRVPIEGVSLKPVKSSSMINKEDAKLKAGGYQGPTPEWIQTLSGSREKLFRRPRDEMFHSAEWNYYSDKIKKGERWTRGWT